MQKAERALQGPGALERALAAPADRLAVREATLLHRLPYASPVGLFKDLVVLFHERDPQAATGSAPDHAGVIADMQQSFHAELERYATRGDIDTSAAVALGILRALAEAVPARDDAPPAGAGASARAGPGTGADRGSKDRHQGAKHAPGADASDPVGVEKRGTRPDSSLSTPQEAGTQTAGYDGWLDLLEGSVSGLLALSGAQLDAARDAVVRAIHLSRLAKTTGVEQILRPPHITTPPVHPSLLEQMAGVLGRNRDLLRILRQLGRLSEREAARRATGVRPPAGELHDVQLGADLDMVLPSELALLSHPHPAAKFEFFRRYTERALLQYTRRPQPEGRGPVCVCIDNSPSMVGGKMVVARAAALFCVRQAMAEHRDAMLVLFDTTASAYYFPWQRARADELMNFLGAGVGNGTRYRAGLRACRKCIDEHARQQGDILLIGDAEEAPSPKDMRWFGAFQRWMAATGTRLFAVHTGTAQEPMVDVLRGIAREVLVLPLADEEGSDTLDRLSSELRTLFTKESPSGR